MQTRPQQAHRLDVLALLRQVDPQDALGMDQLPVGEQAAGLDDLGRQVAQRGKALRNFGGVLVIAPSPVQGVQHLPAVGQGGVDVHSLPEGVDGLRDVVQSGVTVAAFLVQGGCSGDEAAAAAPAHPVPRRSARESASSRPVGRASRGSRGIATAGPRFMTRCYNKTEARTRRSHAGCRDSRVTSSSRHINNVPTIRP